MCSLPFDEAFTPCAQWWLGQMLLKGAKFVYFSHTFDWMRFWLCYFKLDLWNSKYCDSHNIDSVLPSLLPLLSHQGVGNLEFPTFLPQQNTMICCEWHWIDLCNLWLSRHSLRSNKMRFDEFWIIGIWIKKASELLKINDAIGEEKLRFRTVNLWLADGFGK